MTEKDKSSNFSLDEKYIPSLKRFKTISEPLKKENNKNRENGITSSQQGAMSVGLNKQINEKNKQSKSSTIDKNNNNSNNNNSNNNNTPKKKRKRRKKKEINNPKEAVVHPESRTQNKKNESKNNNLSGDQNMSPKNVKRRASFNYPSLIDSDSKSQTIKSENTKKNLKETGNFTFIGSIQDEYIESEEENESSIEDEYIESESEEDNKGISDNVNNNVNVDFNLHILKENKIISDDNSFCYKKRKNKLWWTHEETKALLEGVIKFGRGKWSEIYKDNITLFRNRRKPRELSDKMRTIDKNASIYVYSNKVYTHVDESKNPILYDNGLPKTYLCKFPHEAAIMVAKNLSLPCDDIIRVVCEDDGEKSIHIYKFFKTCHGRVRVRKLCGKSKKRVDG